MNQEAGRRDAVDDAMIPRKHQRQNEAWTKLLAVPHRSGLSAGNTQNSNFWSVDDGREACTADPSQGGDRKAAPLHIRRVEFSVPRLSREIGGLIGDLRNTLRIDVADHRHDQSVRCVSRESDMKVALQNEFVAVQ